MGPQWRGLRTVATKKELKSTEGPAWRFLEKRVDETSTCLTAAISMLKDQAVISRFRSLQGKKTSREKLLDKLLKASSYTNEFKLQLAELKKIKQKEDPQSITTSNTGKLPEEKLCDRNDEQEGTVASELLREENIKLKEKIEVLAENNAAKVAALEEAQENCSCALEQARKHKEVIARTTADNMLFLMKLKQAEGDLQNANRKHEDLQKQVAFYRSTWLEEASAEIEDAVRSSLDKAQACEVQLQKLHKQQELRMRDCEMKLQELTNNLSSINATKRDLEDRIRACEEERMTLQCKLEKEASERYFIQKQNESLTSAIDKYTAELVSLTEKHQKLVEEFKAKNEELERKHKNENQFLMEIESIKDRLQTQRAMNISLMKKKEEVEWMWLEAQAEREKIKQHVQELYKS